MSIIERFCREIDRCSVISFDVFDTLLLRPFITPSDIFYYIEDKYGIKGFAEARYNVKVLNKAEKTIEDIYLEIAPEYRDMIEKELLEEYVLIYPNEKMKRIFEYAHKKNKKIIIVSDIYFHEGYMRKLLAKNGFSDFDKIYCSCDYQKTKCNGDLFDQVIKDMGEEPVKILHIGDNEVSDFAVPKSKKVNAVLVEQNSEKYYCYRSYLPERYNSYWDSFINKICADNFALTGEDNSREGCWYRFGHDAAGPICWAFAKWIETQTEENKEISDLAFIARDGYLIKKMFDKLPHSRNVASHYVYAPRILAALLQDNFMNQKEMQDLIEQEKSIISEVYNLENIEKKTAFIDELQNIYSKYLKDEEFGRGIIGVVDSTTNNLSSQKLISHFSDNDTCGLYWFASQYAHLMGYPIKTCQKEQYIVVDSQDLFELIFKSYEPAIKTFSSDGKIVFNQANESEQLRISNFEFLDKGAMDFFEAAESKHIIGCPDAGIINQYLIRYCENPISIEKKYIESFYCSGGIANSVWTPTSVFIERKRGISKKSISNKIKRELTKHPKIFVFLRGVYHKIKY